MPQSRSKNVFAPVFLALALTILAGSVALMAWSAAEHYLPELNIKDPAIAAQEPFLSDAPPRLSQRVVLVIIDGLRLRDSFGHPTLERLRRAGVDTIALSHYPTISRPNHACLVTGVPPLISGIRNNTFNSLVHFDSLMDRLQAAELTATTVADDSPSMGFLFGDDFESLYYGRWPGAFAKSTNLALSQGTSSLLVLIPGTVDLAGHEYGGDSPEYRQAVVDVDRLLEESLRLVDLRYDTVIITADHGHTDSGGHGGEEPDAVQVPLILAGAGIAPNALLGTTELNDIAPTIAALLGLPAPGHSVGRTLTEVLELDEANEVALQAADALRIQRNTKIYNDSLKASDSDHRKARRNRFYSLILLFGIALLLMWLVLKAGALQIDWRVLLIVLPAYPLCYYGLLNILGESLSFSTLRDRGSEMSNLIRFGLIATCVQLLAGWLALRGRVVLRDRLASANAIVACGLLLAWLPAGILWAYHGPPPHLTIPGSRIALLIPANYIAVATYAVGVSVLLILEIVIFFARAIDPRIRLQRLERAAARQRSSIENPP